MDDTAHGQRCAIIRIEERVLVDATADIAACLFCGRNRLWLAACRTFYDSNKPNLFNSY